MVRSTHISDSCAICTELVVFRLGQFSSLGVSMLYRFACVRLREGTRTHFDRYTDFKWPLATATPKERPVQELPSLNKAVKGAVKRDPHMCLSVGFTVTLLMCACWASKWRPAFYISTSHYRLRASRFLKKELSFLFLKQEIFLTACLKMLLFIVKFILHITLNKQHQAK